MLSAEAVITSMLKENTGIAMMDSGGDNGRAWQRNQKRDFKKEAASTLEIDVGRKDLVISLSTYYYLTEFWESTPESERLQKEFLKFVDLPKNERAGWLELMDSFFDHYLKPEIVKNDYEAYNVSAGGKVNNTYNYDSTVDQVLQYMLFPWKGSQRDGRHNAIPYMMLQIHGGADARGGYTAPHIFAFKAREHDIDEFYITDGDYNVNIGDEQWYTDDQGAHWYFEGSTSRSMGRSEFAEYIGKFVGVTDDTLKFEGDLYGCLINKAAGRQLTKLERSRMTETKQAPYEVFLKGRLIDTVYYDITMTLAGIKKDLVDHDHYDPTIVVARGR